MGLLWKRFELSTGVKTAVTLNGCTRYPHKHATLNH